MTREESIANKLLDIGAIFLKPNDMFTWASGIKSPIYCDNRMTLSYPEVRNLIKNAFVELIKKEYPQTQAIAGVATAGIPHASLIANELNLPMVYVRADAKSHGRENQIEGKLPAGTKVLVVEDLISTGGSSLKAVSALQDASLEVLGLVAIFTYNLQKAKDNFKNANVPYHTLSNYETLIEVALKRGDIQASDLAILTQWCLSGE
jgi:orotate phosphoribosyltransferase